MYENGSNLRLASSRYSRAGETHVSPLKQRLLISVGESHILLDFSEIVRCHADGSYCRLITKKGKVYLVSKTISRFCKALPPGRFIRTHQSHLVRYSVISEVQKDVVVLNDGTEIPLARARRKEVLAQIKQRSVVI
jgi:two-component system LytT family response regulator